MARKPKEPPGTQERPFREPPRGVDPEWDLTDVSNTWNLLAARTTDSGRRAIATMLDALDSLAASPDRDVEAELVKIAEGLLRKRHGHVPMPRRTELAEAIATSLEKGLSKEGRPVAGESLAHMAVAVLEAKCSEDLVAFEQAARDAGFTPKAAERIQKAIDGVNERHRLSGKKFDALDWSEAYTKAIFRALGCPNADNLLKGRYKQRIVVPQEETPAEESARMWARAQEPDMVAEREKRQRQLEAKFGKPKRSSKSTD